MRQRGGAIGDFHAEGGIGRGIAAEFFDQLRPLRPHNLRGPAAGKHAEIGMPADDGDPAHCMRGKRQKIAHIAQQHHAGLRRCLRNGGIGRDVDRGGMRRIVGHANPPQGAGDAAGGIPHARRHGGIGRGGRGKRRAEPYLGIELLAGFLIQARHDGRGCMHRTPIRHHPAGIVPVTLQNIVQQPGAFAGVGAIYPVIRAHHRSGLTLFDGDFEGQQIAFPRGRFANHGVVETAPGFQIVQREMLDGGNNVLVLNAFDGGAGDAAGEQWILAGVFEIAAVARIARQIHATGQQHVKPLRAGLMADHRTGAISEFG